MLEMSGVMLFLTGSTIGIVAVVISEAVLAHFGTCKYDWLKT